MHTYYQKYNGGTRTSKFFEGVGEREKVGTPALHNNKKRLFVVAALKVLTVR